MENFKYAPEKATFYFLRENEENCENEGMHHDDFCCKSGKKYFEAQKKKIPKKNKKNFLKQYSLAVPASPLKIRTNFLA